ncbi:adhesion protein [Escherichia coli]|uniref:Adhesion protein n=1 Tax=Escherichia coli TaxID=562 RepID=A0A2X3KAN9_ECOLX|nr:adhesion protein [Escherichia coli]
MLINGSVLSKGGLINLDMHPGSVWTGSSLSDNVNGGKLDVAMNNSVWNVTSNSNLDTLALSPFNCRFCQPRVNCRHICHIKRREPER